MLNNHVTGLLYFSINASMWHTRAPETVEQIISKLRQKVEVQNIDLQWCPLKSECCFYFFFLILLSPGILWFYIFCCLLTLLPLVVNYWSSQQSGLFCTSVVKRSLCCHLLTFTQAGLLHCQCLGSSQQASPSVVMFLDWLAITSQLSGLYNLFGIFLPAEGEESALFSHPCHF